MGSTSDQGSPTERGWFTTTHWSVVLAAKAEDTKLASAALETLCRSYWPPLYTFIRRQGYGVEDAQDLTQEFLSRFVQNEWLKRLEDRRGKFRSFLLTYLKHFLSDQRDRAKAQKRGGGRPLISLEAMAEEEKTWAEPQDGRTPEQAYERRWALALLEHAVRRLQAEYEKSGNGPLYAFLKDLQPGERGEHSYLNIGRELGLSEQAVKSAVYRLRHRHREILREEIAQTLNEPHEVEEEIQHLMTVLS